MMFSKISSLTSAAPTSCGTDAMVTEQQTNQTEVNRLQFSKAANRKKYDFHNWFDVIYKARRSRYFYAIFCYLYDVSQEMSYRAI